MENQSTGKSHKALIITIAALLLAGAGIANYLQYQHVSSLQAYKLPQDELLARGIPPSDYESYLEIAITGNNTELLGLLLTAGTNPNFICSFDRSPLYLAVQEGHTECVKLLLAAPGIDVNETCYYGNSYFDYCTPLHRAAKFGHAKCVKLLLAAPGIDVNKANYQGCTPLHWAAENGHAKCVKLLLAAPGIDVNKANNYGCTPLHDAAVEGHTECVKLLLAAPGIDVNIADHDGDTPLYWAAENGHTKCVKLLKAAGARK